MEVVGTIIKVSKQWWLKINTKPIRLGTMDGAIFPYIVKIKYTVNETSYIKREWISAGKPVPNVGSSVRLIIDTDKPSKAKIID